MQKTTLKVLVATLVLTIFIFIGSFIYYGSINSAEDPRVLPARQLLQQYEKQLEEDQPALALSLLDEMETIYQSVPGYSESYEVGVVLNNKATVYLVQVETQILEEKDVDRQEMLKNLDIAQKHTEAAIQLYENWLSEMGNLNETQVQRKIEPFFQESDPAFKELDVKDVLAKRVEDILLAQVETKRRMSVSLTNLGFINRYRGNLEEALENYQMAITLWERNYTAQDNLNMLLNRPVQKRSIIDRLFPPERKKQQEKENS